MKNYQFLLFILLVISCNRNSRDNSSAHFQIIGKTDISSRTIAYLKTQERGNTLVIDSTILKNGKFEFSGRIDKPAVFGIYIDSIKGAIGLFMENSTITIEAYTDSLSSSKISGSKTHNDYINFIKQSKRITSKISILFPEFQKARAENDAERLENINKRMQAINNENTLFTLKYAKQNPNSYISAYALHSVLRISNIEKDTISKIYTNFSDYVKKGDYAIEIAQFLNEK